MTIQEYMFRRFREFGMTIEGACATLAQIQHEGAFRPNNAEDSKGVQDDIYTQRVDSGQMTKQQFMCDGIGYGYAQWTYPTRKGLMYDYFKARKKSIADSDTQIDFLIWEMKSYFPNQWKLVTSSHDLYSCTWELLDKWENPAEKTNNMKRRFDTAQKFFGQFQNLTPGKAVTMTKQEAIQKVLNLATSEIGYHEKASNANLDDKYANSGSGNWTKYARDLAAISNFYNGNKNGYAWCDVFVDWLFVKCFGAETGRQMLCQPYNSAGAGCLYSAQYYKQNNQWSFTPQLGAQVFFTYSAGEVSHTGIVADIVGTTITTIEGNSSDQVAKRTYNQGNASIYGYGIPKWELAANSSASATESSMPVSSDSSAYYGVRILKKGMSGEDVKKVQEDLISLGYDLGRWGADGDFGNDTDSAVRKFQQDNNLSPVDGEVGPDTIAALEKALKKKEEASKPAPSNDTDDGVPRQKMKLRVLKIDMEGSDVKLAQAALQCWGYTTIVSGIFGKEMDEKIRDFQQKKGLDSDGEIGTQTWKKLLEL